ncbi:hypothetical protein B0A48_11058 [Cryoendolithus antarcticus]|uniref:Rhodopsin domain-containing protein n=1 Tax=Cryoendolithus antarcticus TaxID=1507870 RepID=A0A1V8SUE5_9PEZI|nr:hypothetical protein B0A48_11058 [Cryoendolithus antarcticus]
MSDEAAVPALPTFSLSNLLLVVTSILLVWTTLFAAVRVWAKTQSQWHWADYIFLGGYVFCAAQCATICLAIGQYGFGAEVAMDEIGWQKALYASQILYILSVGTSRCSMALFLRNLSRDKKDTKLGVAVAAVALLWTVASVLAIAIRGDASGPWLSVSAFFGRWLGVEVAAILVELVIWSFSIMLIWRLNMAVQKRIKLLLIFASQAIVSVNILTQIVMHAALISECVTCLKPFLQTFHEGVAIPGGGSTYWGALTNVSQMPQSKSGGTQDSRRSRIKFAERSWQENSGNHGLRPLADRATITTKIMSERKERRSQRVEGDDDIELLPSSAIHVQRTTTVSAFR